MNNSKYSWCAWPLEHYHITLLIVAILFGLGVYGMYVMPKDEFPPFVIRQGVVVAVYPGATSEEVEQQVTRPLERFLFTYGEVKRHKCTSTSQNGMSIILVHLNDEVNNKDEVWSKIKHGLALYKQNLPKGVAALVANDDFGNTSALLIAVESPERSYRELQDYCDRLGDRLRKIPSVANVRQYGEHREQLSLYLDRQRLEAFGIGQITLMSALQAEGLTTIAGSILNDHQQTLIHIEPTNNSEQEVADMIIYSDPSSGKSIRVRDIATVRREYDLSDSQIEQNGHPCLLLSMEMNAGHNIMAYGEEVDEVLNEFASEELPDDVTLTRIADQPKVVSMSIHDFLRDLLLSMAAIILVMMILFPLRSAIVAAITIPLSSFISVSIMFFADIPLNIVTLAGLIVVLGMIVDNSIVVIDGYLEYVEKGEQPKDAAMHSVRQYFMPMMLATICICAIFYPYLITFKGAFLDALGDFPWTITINLMVSLAIAVAVIPFLCVYIIKVPKKKAQNNVDGKTAAGGSITDYVQRIYDRILAWTFRRPYLTIGLGLATIPLSMLIVPQLKVRLFPFCDRDQFAVEIFLPDGKGLADTRLVADSVYNAIRGDERITGITTFLGCSSPRFQTCYAPQMGGPNFAQFIVNTTSQQATLDLLDCYQPKLSEAFPEAYVKFKRLDLLEVPELEFRFYGENIDSLHAAAEALMAQMREIPELEWVHSDFLQPFPIINVTLDPIASAQLGINRTSASLAIASSTGDLPVGSIWEDDYEVPIIVRDTSTLNVSDVENIGLPSIQATFATALSQTPSMSRQTSTAVPLRQVAQVKPLWSENRIMHRAGERCMTVTAEFVRGTYAAPVEQRLAEMTHALQLPEGVRAEVGGELEYNDEQLPMIINGILIAMIIIFFFILFNFKRFGITFLCMAALGLMVPGALIGLGIMNRTIGLTSIFGLVTLMGIIMRNEILIFEHADGVMKRFHDDHPLPSPQDAEANSEEARNAYRYRYNQAVEEAAYDAGHRRMVPIFLTTATTAVGVIPMIIAGSSFWMPVGVTIFAGGIGTLILVVTILPVVYWKLSLKK
ncbi:MAG: efflux RND transporter permease subunit [Bacteroidaceae bacterium]|nr:efflux RND transporter permease subunit [Bacteroidaceae bacterium]